MIVGAASLGAFSELESTVFTAFWLFCVTPLVTALALIGFCVLWAGFCAGVVHLSLKAKGTLRRNADSNGDAANEAQDQDAEITP